MADELYPTGLSALSSFLKKPEVKDIWYHNKVIKLDGFKFVSCRFDGCSLILTSTNFELDKCIIDDATTIQYGSDIARSIKLFNSRYDWAYKYFPEAFVATRNLNGMITIK